MNLPFSQISGPAIHHPTALTYASSVLGQLGTATFTYGYWAHDLAAFLARCWPNSVLLLILDFKPHWSICPYYNVWRPQEH